MVKKTVWFLLALLAAIALGVGTTYIMKTTKLKYALTTFIPMLFMFVMTLTAAWQLIGMFTEKMRTTVSIPEFFSLKIDVFLLILMAALAVVALFDMFLTWYGLLRKRAPLK